MTTKSYIDEKIAEFKESFWCGCGCNDNGFGNLVDGSGEAQEAESFVREALEEAYSKGREDGGEKVAQWIRNYAPRICLNDVMKNVRPELADMVVSDLLIDQALQSHE